MTTVGIVPLTRTLAEDIVAGNRQPEWCDDFPSDGDTAAARLVADGRFPAPTADAPWGPWLVVVDGDVVGSVGSHGAPDDDGAVEIGYGLSPSARGRGHATDAVRQLLAILAAHDVSTVVAETDPANTASHGVLERSGFTRTPVDGDVALRWRRDLL
jgi:RimJ/RimL family protein N-acetyltransferase